ncbi:class I SAM-dependent methyltransferase [Komagataeibacter sp. FNDCR2]|uniref:class I SAM-dependent methyltransferase n=1 Tax=Komagataeibacter sp. FNDCR2 TaxID=2878682 RepID=UPI001E4D6C96|nr:class I SAM-dependent methyltransferase [Komagataeibacter sp. FNDCR2]MCE2574095.1 class I SAM-dependent methyltransferase [Komagataeibacter sp. FNDCR2]
MKECSKSISRRLQDSNFVRKYFVGNGIDIGGKPDPLVLYQSLFPGIASLRTWDWEDGDAQFMKGVADNSIDFVFSSHCLEHLHDPYEGLKNWFRIVRPGGYLIVDIPEEDMYEQGIFPSTHNKDHKTSWTVLKDKSWSSRSINVLDLVRSLGSAADIRKIEVIDALFRSDLPRYDQTITPVAECAIEFIIRKRNESELKAGGLLPDTIQPVPEVRRHLNQYKNDKSTLRTANPENPPFLDEKDI